jgi:signal transduction histidine kinase
VSRLTVRAKLAFVYGGLFLLAGTALLAVTYGLVRHSLDTRPAAATVIFSTDSSGAGSVGAVAGQQGVSGVPDDVGIAKKTVAFGAPEPIDPVTGEKLSSVLGDVEAAARAATLRRLLVQSGYALVVMAIASVGLGWWIAGRALAPVHQITARARRATRENLHERIDLDGPDDELKELADTFDAMLGRLDTAFESQRRFVADASHELRTPLATMRTEVDVALADPDASVHELRSTAVRVRDAVGRSERLIESLLVLARSDRGVVERERVDMAALVRRVLASVPTDGLRVESALAPLTVDGDPALLERMVANLVENAVRHNIAEDGWLRVEVGEGPVLRVANSGEVIEPSEVEGLFEPFRRTGMARTRSDRGAGLGLAIVRSVALAHGAKASARARADGGLEVEVAFSSN